MDSGNIKLAAISLLLSVGLFLAVHPLTDPDRELEVEIDLVHAGLPEDLTIISGPTKTTLVARGSAQELEALDADRITATADLSGASEGVYSAPIDLELPLRSPLEIEPAQAQVQFELERKTTREFEVEIVERGAPPEGLSVRSLAVFPATVMVSGPASRVDEVASVRASIDLRRLQPGAEITLHPEPLNANGLPVLQVETEPKDVRVVYAMQPIEKTRELPIRPVWRGEPAPGFEITSVEIEPEQAVVTGEPRVLARLLGVATDPIDVSGLRKDKRFEVLLDPPDGVALQSPTVAIVRVRVSMR